MEPIDYTQEFNTIIEQQQEIIENQEELLTLQDKSLLYIVAIAVILSANMFHHLFDATYKKK